MKTFLLRIISVLTLNCIYLTSYAWSVLFKKIHGKRKKKGRVIINATFHNPNWFFAHIAPITQSGYGEVILITDDIVAEIPGLRYFCPPKWVSSLVSRAGAKAIWTFVAGIKYPSDVFIGYHIFPSAITALLCARFFGAKAIYQVTYGEAEIKGGGWEAENALLRALQRPSYSVERSAIKVSKEFDLIVVRGNNARKFFLDHNCVTPIEIVTGSVEVPKINPNTSRETDIIFVARVAESKRPIYFLDIISGVMDTHPELVVQVVGEGEQLDLAKEYARKKGIQSNVDFLGKRRDVMQLLSNAKIFILPSRWEGVSIALMEAMVAGAVPLVSDVGDLADFVIPEETGYIFELEDEPSSYSNKVKTLLNDKSLLSKMQENAMEFARSRSERSVLASRWRNILDNLGKC